MSLNSLGNSISRVWLVGEWLLDWNRNDTSWNWYNWSWSNVTYVKTTKWYQAQAWSFNGSSSSISTTYTRSWDTSPFTLTAWIYSNNTTVWTRPVWWSDSSFRNSACSMYSFVWWSSNKMYWLIRSSTWTSYDLIHNSIQNANTWEMYTLTYDWSTVNIYKNGVLDWTKTWVASIWNRALWFGRALNNSAPVFNWQIQLARIYNRALSQDEIQLLYLEGQRKLWPTSIASYPNLLDGIVYYADFKWNAHNLVDGSLATVSWATLTTDRFWNSNSAYRLDWINDNINIWNLFSKNIKSFSFWLKLDPSATYNWNTCILWWTAWLSVPWWLIRIWWATWIPNCITFSWVWNFSLENGNMTYTRNVRQMWTFTTDWTTWKVYRDWILVYSASTTYNTLFNDNQTGYYLWWNEYDNTYAKFQIWEILWQTKTLSADEVSSLYKLTSQDYIYPSPSYDLLSLREWLVLDLNEQWKDLSGSSNHWTLVNAPTVVRQWKAKGLSYNGSNQLISIWSDLWIAWWNITMSAYVKLNTEISSWYYTIIKQNDLTSWVGFQMYYEYNWWTRRLTFQRVRVWIAWNPVYYNITLWTSNRYHLSLVNNTSDNTIKIYLNWVLVWSATSSNLNWSQSEADLTAIWCYWTSLYANAKIISPRIRNRALSSTEIQQLYYSQKGSFVY